jgi:PilZ domain
VGQPVKDRRADPRYGWSSEDITQATLRPGCVVQVVDLSAGGALVQAGRPLRPGARLHFHLVVRRQTFRLIARVLRCAVWALDSRHGVTYRGALQFEERFEMREIVTLVGSAVQIAADTERARLGMSYPA